MAVIVGDARSRRAEVRSCGRGRGLSATAAALLLALLLGATVLGCGDEEATTLDRDATQRAVSEVVAARLEPRVRAVECPEEIPLETGTSIRCEVDLLGAGILPVEVTQTDDDGTLDVVLLEAVVDQLQVATDLKANLKDEFGRSFQADCGRPGYAVFAPGDTFACTARDKTSRRQVEVTVVDAAGTVRYEVLDPEVP